MATPPQNDPEPTAPPPAKPPKPEPYPNIFFVEGKALGNHGEARPANPQGETRSD